MCGLADVGEHTSGHDHNPGCGEAGLKVRELSLKVRELSLKVRELSLKGRELS